MRGLALSTIIGLAASTVSVSAQQDPPHPPHPPGHTGPMFPHRDGEFAGIHYSMFMNNFSTDDHHVSIKRGLTVRGNVTRTALAKLLSHLDEEAKGTIKPGSRHWKFEIEAYQEGTSTPASGRLLVTYFDDGKQSVKFQEGRVSK